MFLLTLLMAACGNGNGASTIVATHHRNNMSL
jgi:galactitol-specific phosphotransferase system IIB component